MILASSRASNFDHTNIGALTETISGSAGLVCVTTCRLTYMDLIVTR